MQAGDAGATEEVEEEGFDGVVAVVGCGHAGEPVPTAEVAEPGVAQMAGGLLDAHATGVGDGPGVEVDGVENGACRLGKATDKLLVAVAVAGGEMEISVGHGEGDAGAPAEVEHGHGVAAAANSKQHLLPHGEEVLLLNEFLESLQHQRRIILRMRRLPSTTMP